MLYINKEYTESYEIDPETSIDRVRIDLSIIIGLLLDADLKREVSDKHLLLPEMILRHFCDKGEGLIINIDITKCSEIKSLLNALRDDLCYPQTTYFNIICTKDQEKTINQMQRITDFIRR